MLLHPYMKERLLVAFIGVRPFRILNVQRYLKFFERVKNSSNTEPRVAGIKKAAGESLPRRPKLPFSPTPVELSDNCAVTPLHKRAIACCFHEDKTIKESKRSKYFKNFSNFYPATFLSSALGTWKSPFLSRGSAHVAQPHRCPLRRQSRPP